MTALPARTRPNPRPVRLGRYRYSKLRWRLAAHALDFVGGLAVRLTRPRRAAVADRPPRRILVVQLDHLGDAVLSSPLLARLRAAYPAATLDVLASPSNREVFEADPHVDRVRVAARSWFERRRGQAASLSAVWSLGRSLRGAGYDLGIDVRGDILSVLVLTLARIPRRAGWAMGGGGFLLTAVAPWVPGRHEVRSRQALLDALGVPPDDPARVTIQVPDADRAGVAQRLREAWPDPRRATPLPPARQRQPARSAPAPFPALARAISPRPAPPAWDEPDGLHAGRFGDEAPLLVAHLGAGTAAKRWGPRHWDDLIGRFSAEGWRVIVVGGVEDAEAAESLTARGSLRDWTGRLSVTQTAALLERADLFVGADSGPSHLAACAGIPSVVLFSGTNRSAQWRPWSRRTLVLRHKVPCRPCHHKVCPLADHPCMNGLTPERVHRAAKRWWARLHREESPHAPL